MIDRQRISIHVAQAVQDTIANLGLKPGDKLPSQAELARQLSVSVPTLREGLERLEFVGVVRAVHGTGTIVTEPSGDGLSCALAPFLSAQPQRHHELVELFYILQSALVRDVIDFDSGETGITEQAAVVKQSDTSESLSQSLMEFFRSLCVRHPNRTILGLVNMVHELVLFRAAERGVLWPQADQIKHVVQYISDGIIAKDRTALEEKIRAYAHYFSWQSFADVTTITLGTGSPGGSFDRFGARLCSFFANINEVNIDAMTTGGGVENVDLVDLGRVGFAITQSDVALEAFRGGRLFSRPRTGIRAVCRLSPLNLWTVVRADSGVSSLHELYDARISAGAVGSSTALVTDSILETLGFSGSNHRIFRLSLLNAINALRHGELDAFFYLSQNPFVALEELHRTVPVKVLPVPEETGNRVMQKHGFWKRSYASFARLGADEPEVIQTIGMPTLLIANHEIDRDVVALTCRVIEGHAVALLVDGRSEEISLQSLFGDLPIPAHHGVEDFLQKNEHHGDEG